MTSHAGAGHIGPLLPFAGALRRAGDDVVIAAPPRARAVVERAGLPFRPFAEAPEKKRDAIMSSLDGLTDEEMNARVVGELFTRLDGRAGYPDLLAACHHWRPELVLHETTEAAGYLAAELHGIPHARVGLVLGSSELMLAAAVPPVLDELRAELGLPPDPEGARLLDSPFVTLTPKAMEDPKALGPAQARRFREADHGAPDLPADWWPAEMRRRPLVYLTFGSVLPQMDAFPGLYRTAIDQLTQLPVRVLVTIGTDRTPADLGFLPPNVHVEQWVPQRDVMPHAAAMVGHGGFGTTRMGLSAGVPTVVVPSFADQPFNARRVAELGAGIALGGPEAVGELGEAVHRLLEDPSYRAAAQRIAEDVAGLPSVDEAPAYLRELAHV